MDERSPTCVLVLCGLPAVGKTSLAQAMLDHLVQRSVPIKAFHVCFDLYIDKELKGTPELERAEPRGAPEPEQAEARGTLESEREDLVGGAKVEQLCSKGPPELERADLGLTPAKPLQGDRREAPEREGAASKETPEQEWAEFSSELWKRGRRLAIHKVEELLREAKDKEGPLPQRTLVITDDNFHLRSMRRELYLLARTHRAATVFLHTTAPLETSLSRNALRSREERVPKETILRMAAAFEPPGQSVCPVGNRVGFSPKVCQSEGADINANVPPKEEPRASEPAETEDAQEIQESLSVRRILTQSADKLLGKAPKMSKLEAPGKADVGERQGQESSMLSINEAVRYNLELSRGPEARHDTADNVPDGESTVPERGQKGRGWEAPVVIVDTSDDRGRNERAAEVWERVWNAWGQPPEEPPDRAEEEAKRAAAAAATADSILHALDLRTRRALASAMVDADETGEHFISDKKTSAQRLNRARKQLMTAVRLTPQTLEAGRKKDALDSLKSIRVLLEELSDFDCGDGLDIREVLDHGRSFRSLGSLATVAGDWFESFCGRQRRIQMSDFSRQYVEFPG